MTPKVCVVRCVYSACRGGMLVVLALTNLVPLCAVYHATLYVLSLLSCRSNASTVCHAVMFNLCDLLLAAVLLRVI